MRIRTPAPRRARIEIIPMIDTIFFLLVFFMYSSLSMIRMKGINAALPRTAASSPKGAVPSGGLAHLTVLTLAADGSLYLGRTPTPREDLAASLQSRLQRDPGMVVVLNLDPSESTQSLITLMDTLNKVHGPDGSPLRTLIATERVGPDGRALRGGASEMAAKR